MLLAKANHQSKPMSSILDAISRSKSSSEANHRTQPSHPSWMSLAEANNRTQPNRPSWIPSAEANQQLNQHFIIGLTFVNNSINIS